MNTFSTPKTPPQKLSESVSEALQHTSYVLEGRRQVCRCCRRPAGFAMVWEVWTHPTKTATTGLKVLRPQLGPTLKDLPVSHYHKPDETIPFCFACLPQTLGKPLAPVSESEWARTLQRKASDTLLDERKTAAAAPRNMTPTLDDL